MSSPDWTQYTDEELAKFPQEIWEEHERRHTLATAQQTIQDTNRKYLDAAGIKQGDAWVQPVGAHDSYPLDWVVTHQDKTWVSLNWGNVHEPGVSGWREQVTPGNECPDFVQPTGAHDVYNTGDCVTFDGAQYVSLIDNNSWSPADYPEGWELQQ